MLFKTFISGLALVQGVLGGPVNVRETQLQESGSGVNITLGDSAPTGGLQKRTKLQTTLPDGNECQVEVLAGDFTQAWDTHDYAQLYYQAGNALTNSISRNNRVQVGLTMSFTDSNGRSHQVDCEVTNTGHASVSLQGAYQNVDQALAAMQGLAEHDWTGLIGTTRSYMYVFFGNVIALSVAVNVLN